MDWQPRETAPADTAIMLGKWSSDDQLWYWQASGCIEAEGLWIDFNDSFHAEQFFHEATHWCPLDYAPPSLPSPPLREE